LGFTIVLWTLGILLNGIIDGIQRFFAVSVPVGTYIFVVFPTLALDSSR